jgi:hypothetical protein
VQHIVQRRRVEVVARCHGERPQHVRLDRRRVPVRQAPGGMGQHIRIRIQERDLCVVRQPRLPQEVASTGPDIQMPVAHTLPVLLHEARGRAPPHNVAIEPEDQGIIDPQERSAVHLLARLGRVRGIHYPSGSGVRANLATYASRISATRRLNASVLPNLSGDRRPEARDEPHGESYEP